VRRRDTNKFDKNKRKEVGEAHLGEEGHGRGGQAEAGSWCGRGHSEVGGETYGHWPVILEIAGILDFFR
jgi:hypothetical protein